eukprot:Skav234621  [mRNA]  locus=scaffold835:71181:71450:- [translate_table: standard]
MASLFGEVSQDPPEGGSNFGDPTLQQGEQYGPEMEGVECIHHLNHCLERAKGYKHCHQRAFQTACAQQTADRTHEEQNEKQLPAVPLEP